MYLKKFGEDNNLELGANIGFRIINVNKKDMIGQIELKYDVDLIVDEKESGKIILVMNALFKVEEKINEKDFEEKLKIDGATTLSHLCRAYISTATALSGMPTINMPLINFNQFFEDAVEENNAKQNK